ncbi:hypothetical protein RUND412_003247 [Rhizina undulata]
MTEAYTQAAEICLTMMCRPTIYHEPHPLREYMLENWAYHIRFSGDASNSLLELQNDFFKAYYAWLQEAENRWETFKPMQPETKLTPLWVASYYQLWDVCKTLLMSNLDNYNVHNESGTTASCPSLAAAYSGVSSNLVLEFMSILFFSSNSLTTSSFPNLAAKNNGVLKLFLEKEGVDLNSKTKTGGTPLWAAARRGHEAVVKILFEKEGVDLNSKDDNGETPLWAAASAGHEPLLGYCSKRRKMLGSDHPTTLTAMSNMALVFKIQRRYNEALEMYRRALAGYENALGSDHNSTPVAVHNMALVFYKQGRHDDALEWFQRALAGKEKTLGKDHPDALNTAAWIAKISADRLERERETQDLSLRQ